MAVRKLLKRLLLIAVAGLLSACAMPRMIDSDVESFIGAVPAMPGASYRFERLPSQKMQGADQARVEALADAALARAGLQHDETHPHTNIQVSVQIFSIRPPTRRTPRIFAPMVDSDGSIFYPAPLLVMESPWYSHTVNFVMRDIATAQVSYETTASFDGPWSDSLQLLPVIMDAALRDYPTPPPGLRRVVIELQPSTKGER